MVFQITANSTVCSKACSGKQQRKIQREPTVDQWILPQRDSNIEKYTFDDMIHSEKHKR